MTDKHAGLIKRLERIAMPTTIEAAAEIARFRAENEQLREELRIKTDEVTALTELLDARVLVAAAQGY